MAGAAMNSTKPIARRHRLACGGECGNHPVGHTARQHCQEAHSGPAAAVGEPEGNESGVERQRAEYRNGARDQPRQADDQDPGAGASPPLAIIVGHVAARKTDENSNLQKEEHQRSRQVDHHEHLRIVLRERGQKMVCPGRDQAADKAGRCRGDPGPWTPPATAEGPAHDPGNDHRRCRDQQLDAERDIVAEPPRPEAMHREQEQHKKDWCQKPEDEAPGARGSMSEARQLHGGKGSADGNQDDDRNPVVEIPPVERGTADELGLRREAEHTEIHPGQHRGGGDERDEHHPVDEQVAEHRAAERPDIGGQRTGSWVEELDDAAQSGQRLGLDVVCELFARVSLAPVSRVETPRGEPTPDVAAARHRREIVELAEHAGAGEPLQDAKGEAGAAYSTARQA